MTDLNVLERTVHWDGMCWARYIEPEDDSIQWRLRYGPQPPSREDILAAASVMHCYTALVMATDKKRAEVVRNLRLAERTPIRHVI